MAEGGGETTSSRSSTCVPLATTTTRPVYQLEMASKQAAKRLTKEYQVRPPSSALLVTPNSLLRDQAIQKEPPPFVFSKPKYALRLPYPSALANLLPCPQRVQVSLSRPTTA